MFTYALPARMSAMTLSGGTAVPLATVPVNPMPVGVGDRLWMTPPAESATPRGMWPAMTLSIADVMFTVQVSVSPDADTVTVAFPAAVVVTGVGRSFVPFNVALNTSGPGVLGELLSLQATPSNAAAVANTASSRDTCITILLIVLTAGDF